MRWARCVLPAGEPQIRFAVRSGTRLSRTARARASAMATRSATGDLRRVRAPLGGVARLRGLQIPRPDDRRRLGDAGARARELRDQLRELGDLAAQLVDSLGVALRLDAAVQLG